MKNSLPYANDLAKIVKRNGSRAMAFNDGIYYNSDQVWWVIRILLAVLYWTGGWERL